MRTFVWALLIALVLLHQWDPFRADARLVGGLLPIALVYHVVLSLAAAAAWLAAAKFCWPDVASPPADDRSEGVPPA